MSNEDATKVAEAAVAVMNVLQPLSQEERSRVLQSAAALFGVSVFAAAPVQATNSHHNAHDAGGAVHNSASVSGGGSGKRLSIVEFLKEKEPATNSQRIACFAYFRDKTEGSPHFSRADLSGYFAKAKLSAPGPNYARDYNSAVKESWIHDDGAQSYLTQSGEAAVEAGFGGRRNSPSAPAGKKRKGKKPE